MEHNNPVFIPEDLLFHEILHRLPVESLVRFRLVAKRWNSIISCSHAFHKQNLTFQQSHNKHATTSTLIIIEHEPPLRSPKKLLLKLNVIEEEESSNNVNSLLVPAKELKHGYYETKEQKEFEILIGSSNGLICVCFLDCRDYLKQSLTLRIWNPTTNHDRPIGGARMEPLSNLSLYGFAYDSSSDDYKIVLLIFSKVKSKLFGYLYSLKKHKWREIDSIPSTWLSRAAETIDYCLDNKPVLVRGTLHWLFADVGQQRGWSLVAFDLAKESFSQVPLLPSMVESNVLTHGSLCEINDCLCVCWSRVGLYVTCDWEVWMLERYGVWDSWKILFFVKNQEQSLKLLDVQVDTPMKGSICFENGCLLLIDPRAHNHPLPRLQIVDGSGWVQKVFKHVESLISPYSYE